MPFQSDFDRLLDSVCQQLAEQHQACGCAGLKALAQSAEDATLPVPLQLALKLQPDNVLVEAAVEVASPLQPLELGVRVLPSSAPTSLVLSQHGSALPIQVSDIHWHDDSRHSFCPATGKQLHSSMACAADSRSASYCKSEACLYTAAACFQATYDACMSHHVHTLRTIIQIQSSHCIKRLAGMLLTCYAHASSHAHVIHCSQL